MVASHAKLDCPAISKQMTAEQIYLQVTYSSRILLPAKKKRILLLAKYAEFQLHSHISMELDEESLCCFLYCYKVSYFNRT